MVEQHKRRIDKHVFSTKNPRSFGQQQIGKYLKKVFLHDNSNEFLDVFSATKIHTSGVYSFIYVYIIDGKILSERYNVYYTTK